jgi:hypothetical protein
MAVTFNEAPLFHGFLPTETDPLRFRVDATMGAVVFSSDTPPANVSVRDIGSKSLNIHVEDPVETALAESIFEYERGGAVELWGRAFLRRIEEFLGRLVDYFRNVQGQYWLDRPRIDHVFPDYALRWLQARVATKHGERELQVESSVYIGGTLRVRAGGVPLGDREGIEQFVSEGRRSAAWEEFDANARNEIEAGSYRTAVVESVTALEAAIKRLYPRILFARLGTNTISDRDVEKLVENAGLRTVAAVFLKLQLLQMGWDTARVESLLSAIALRNDLVHGGRRSVDEQTATALVALIHEAIHALKSGA